MKDRIEKWHKQGLWDVEKIKNAVAKGVLTADKFKKITGQKYK